jgi:hypothetical protein
VARESMGAVVACGIGCEVATIRRVRSLRRAGGLRRLPTSIAAGGRRGGERGPFTDRIMISVEYDLFK